MTYDAGPSNRGPVGPGSSNSPAGNRDGGGGFGFNGLFGGGNGFGMRGPWDMFGSPPPPQPFQFMTPPGQSFMPPIAPPSLMGPPANVEALYQMYGAPPNGVSPGAAPPPTPPGDTNPVPQLPWWRERMAMRNPQFFAGPPPQPTATASLFPPPRGGLMQRFR